MTDGLIALDRHNIDRIALALESIAESLQRIAADPGPRRPSDHKAGKLLTEDELADLMAPTLSPAEQTLAESLEPIFGPIRALLEDDAGLYGFDRSTTPATLLIRREVFDHIPERLWPNVVDLYCLFVGGECSIAVEPSGGRQLSPRRRRG